MTLTPAANGNGTSTITLTVTDGTAQAQDTFVQTVVSVNDAPAGTSTGKTTNEDVNYIFAAADFGLTDANDSPANAFNRVLITTVETAGDMESNGEDVTASTYVTAAQLASNSVSLQASSKCEWQSVCDVYVPGRG